MKTAKSERHATGFRQGLALQRAGARDGPRGSDLQFGLDALPGVCAPFCTMIFSCSGSRGQRGPALSRSSASCFCAASVAARGCGWAPRGGRRPRFPWRWPCVRSLALPPAGAGWVGPAHAGDEDAGAPAEEEAVPKRRPWAKNDKGGLAKPLRQALKHLRDAREPFLSQIFLMSKHALRDNPKLPMRAFLHHDILTFGLTGATGGPRSRAVQHPASARPPLLHEGVGGPLVGAGGRAFHGDGLVCAL